MQDLSRVALKKLAYIFSPSINHLAAPHILCCPPLEDASTEYCSFY